MAALSMLQRSPIVKGLVVGLVVYVGVFIYNDLNDHFKPLPWYRDPLYWAGITAITIITLIYLAKFRKKQRAKRILRRIIVEDIPAVQKKIDQDYLERGKSKMLKGLMPFIRRRAKQRGRVAAELGRERRMGADIATSRRIKLRKLGGMSEGQLKRAWRDAGGVREDYASKFVAGLRRAGPRKRKQILVQMIMGHQIPVGH